MAELNYTPPSATGAGHSAYSDDEMPPSTSSFHGEMDTIPPTPATPQQRDHSSASTVRQSPLTPGTSKSVESFNEVLLFLRRNGLQEAEKTLLKEATAKGIADSSMQQTPEKPSATDIESLLASHKSTENDPAIYARDYEALMNLVENSLDKVKPELGALLFPVFAHMYLELICNSFFAAAEGFRMKFSEVQETYWSEDIRMLSRATNESQIETNHLLEAFRNQQYVLRLSKECMNCLKPFLPQHPLLMNIMRTHMKLETSENVPRSKEAVDTMVCGILGEATKAANKSRIYHGILKEPEVGGGTEDVTEEGKKKKAKGKEGGKDKKKGDPNAPAYNRIPLPDLNEKVKNDRKIAAKEYLKRVKLSSDHLPSICLYTLLNSAANGGVCCGDISEDSSVLATGYGNSLVQIFSLAPEKKLKPLKSAAELEQLDKDSDDISHQMLDEKQERANLSLSGHCGPVYGVSLSPDSRTVLSASEDSTVRLWSLETWTNLVVYKVGGHPIWDVAFSSRGYYFATGGADRMAMLWSTDKLQPVRILGGHFSDVNCVRFHPNCNYVVTGSEDRGVRVWDVLNGQCVRQFNGHNSGVQSVQWSPDGKYIASGGSDGRVVVWDVGQGKMLSVSVGKADVSGSKTVNTVAFSRDSTVLAAGGMDNSVRLLHIPSLSVENKNTDSNVSSQEPRSTTEQMGWRSTVSLSLNL